MDHAVNVWMRLEDFVEVVFFSNVDLKEFGSLSADELDTIDGLFRRIVEIVCDYNFVVCFK